ncbi:Calx-beta domain-containing protein [Phormidium sp. CCY1219]|uniref:Calx-beta domain-containing protein n=1 Tax=Phormidium sp. CCY1219 TaxID=2886104 RepID=UPI002D1EB481|nr:Calx-beta domain-containing protein [Phormidium sp. CCY1219]MEB3827791.1 hypothetical protein [Phormidium sp. CCY1219]
MSFSNLSGVTAFVSESDYLALYPDVQSAVSAGNFSSGFQHFQLFGQREGRQPISGYDAAYYLTQNAESFVATDAQAEYILALEGNDNLLGLGGNDFLNGNQGDDEVNGNQGEDTVRGGQGNDRLHGGRDRDRLFGDLGNDTLYGDLGADTLTGGEGSDIFAIARRDDATGFQSTGGATVAQADWILDFERGSDRIELMGGLTFDELNIFDGTDDYSGQTIIQDRGTGDYLAIVADTSASAISRTEFLPFSPTSSEAETPTTLPPLPPLDVPPISPTTPATPTTPTTPTTSSTLAFDAASYTVNEGDGTASIAVTRSGDTSSAVSASVIPSDNTATAGADYTADAIAVNFAAGETTQTVSLPIVEDSDVEGNETVNLSLSVLSSGASLGSQNTATATIVDNDAIAGAPGTLAFSAPTFTVKEDGTAISAVTVTRTGGSNGAVSADVTFNDNTAIAPSDYTNAAISVNFADGETTAQTVSVPIANDTASETLETVDLTLTNVMGGASLGSQTAAALEIVDDDAPNDLPLAYASYLGGAGDDAASAAAISPVDNAIVVAGNIAGAAQLLRFSEGGETLLSRTNLGTDVKDMDIDRDSGEVAVVGDFGMKLFASDGATELRSQPGLFDRVAIANDGTIATLTESTDTVTLWNSSGTQLATSTLSGTDIRPGDIAIHPTSNQVYVTGYAQVSDELQTPFVRGLDSSLTEVWDAWDYSAAQVTGESLGADSRGERLAIASDGSLYFLGKTDGGNNVYTRDGDDIAIALGSRLIQEDNYNNLSGAGSGSFTFFAKLDSTTGAIERGQFIATRLSSGAANSFTPNSIAVDDGGRVYIGGSSAATLKNRDAQTINGASVGNYTKGEMAVLGVSADFTTRNFWTPLTASGDTDGAKGTVNGFAVGNNRAAIFGTVSSPNVATTSDAMNSSPLGGTDAYLATWVV